MVGVLILVLVEDGLGVSVKTLFDNVDTVLILVLVEDGLGECKHIYKKFYCRVLILVLVEDGLGGRSCSRYYAVSS